MKVKSVKSEASVEAETTERYVLMYMYQQFAGTYIYLRAELNVKKS